MKRKRVFPPRKMSAIHRSMLAGATGLAIASSAVALVPAVQITSGSMTVSTANPGGAWMLEGTDLSAGGGFIRSGGQLPGAFTFGAGFPTALGTSVGMSFFSDSADGWFGQMLFKGVNYNLDSDNFHSISSMVLDAGPVVVGHAGSYMEPFTFSASFCGFLTSPMNTCDATVNLVGSGTLDLVVVLDPQQSGVVDFQSVSYQFAGAPEPASIALLLTGLVGLGLTRRRPGARH